MSLRRVPWAAVVLAAQVAASEIDAGVFPHRGIATMMMLFVVGIAPLLVVVRHATALLDVMRRPTVALLAAFAAWTMIAATWSVDPTRGRDSAIGIVGVTVYGAWYVCEHGWTSLRRVVAASLTAFVVVSFIHHAATGRSGRVVGVAVSPTNLGLVSGLAVVLALSLPRHRAIDRVLRVVAPVVGVAGVVASSTRTVAIGLLLVGAYSCVARFGRRGALAALAFVVLLGGGFAIAADGGLIVVTPPNDPLVADSPDGLSISHASNLDEYSTATGRTLIWRESVREILTRPVVGWGTGSAILVFRDVAAQGRLPWYAYGTHDALLGILLAGGAVALALFAAACAAFVADERRAPDLARRAVLLLLLIDGIGESLFDTGRVALLLIAAAFAAASNDAVVRQVAGVRGRAATRRSPALRPAGAA